MIYSRFKNTPSAGADFLARASLHNLEGLLEQFSKAAGAAHTPSSDDREVLFEPDATAVPGLSPYYVDHRQVHQLALSEGLEHSAC